ncbi:MAG: hypothetical protein ACKPKO_23315, partial [Candidatus Fonsibacter sp.]
PRVLIFRLPSSMQEAVVRTLQYGKTGTASIRASVSRTIRKVIEDRLRWRPFPTRRLKYSDEGEGLLIFDKMREYAKDGYAP